jgi:hypothetical protein
MKITARVACHSAHPWAAPFGQPKGCANISRILVTPPIHGLHPSGSLKAVQIFPEY